MYGNLRTTPFVSLEMLFSLNKIHIKCYRKGEKMEKKKRRNNGMGSITQGKDGYWRGKIQIGIDQKTGKRVYKFFSGKTKHSVESEMREYRINGKRDMDILTLNDDHEIEILRDAMNEWLTKIKKMQLKPESYRRLVSICHNHIYPRIGEMKIEKINSITIQNMLINDMYHNGQSLSSIKKAKSAFSDFYYYWRKKQMENRNVYHHDIMSLVDLPSSSKFETKEIKAMTDDEAVRFLNELNKKNKNGTFYYENADIINLILQTGMRIGEALALTVSDYNPDEKSLFIHRNIIETRDLDIKNNSLECGKIKIVIQESVKTTSGKRKIPLNNSAILSIERLIARKMEIDKDTPFIAINKDLGLLWPSNVTRTINIIYKKAGIELSGAHALRHTYATAMFNQGIEVKMVSALLGHSGTQITSDIYIHCLQTLNFGFIKNQVFKPYPEYL